MVFCAQSPPPLVQPRRPEQSNPFSQYKLGNPIGSNVPERNAFSGTNTPTQRQHALAMQQNNIMFAMQGLQTQLNNKLGNHNVVNGLTGGQTIGQSISKGATPTTPTILPHNMSNAHMSTNNQDPVSGDTGNAKENSGVISNGVISNRVLNSLSNGGANGIPTSQPSSKTSLPMNMSTLGIHSASVGSKAQLFSSNHRSNSVTTPMLENRLGAMERMGTGTGIMSTAGMISASGMTSTAAMPSAVHSERIIARSIPRTSLPVTSVETRTRPMNGINAGGVASGVPSNSVVANSQNGGANVGSANALTNTANAVISSNPVVISATPVQTSATVSGTRSGLQSAVPRALPSVSPSEFQNLRDQMKDKLNGDVSLKKTCVQLENLVNDLKQEHTAVEELIQYVKALECNYDDVAAQLEEEKNKNTALATANNAANEALFKAEQALSDITNNNNEAQQQDSNTSSVAPQNLCQTPPFYWTPSPDYAQEFELSGGHNEIVTKVRDFEDKGWVIPVSGSMRIRRGSVYKWSLKIIRKCPHRPQMQFGVHGVNHEKPWRLVTTSRCSRSRDDDAWEDRPGGDWLIEQGDVIHVIVDMRGLNSNFGSFAFAINQGTYEVVFEDIPLSAVMMPIVSMGGDSGQIKLMATA